MTTPRNYDHKATGLDRTDEGGLITCERCGGRRHPALWKHAGQCTQKVDGLFCTNDALPDRRGKPMMFCGEHSVEAPTVYRNGHGPVKAEMEGSTPSGSAKNQSPAFIAASGDLAALMPKEAPAQHYEHPPITEGVLERRDIESQSHPGKWYHMVRMIGRGWCHEDAECIGWTERGHCWHADILTVIKEQTNE